jgi:hypothetical protein
MQREAAMLRKQIIPTPGSAGAAAPIRIVDPDAKDIAALATVLVTSESPDYPVDRLFDGRNGRGGTRWVASAAGEQTLILAFDTPQAIRDVSLEVEELQTSRTQVLTLAVSHDGGRSYREILRQEFVFSPPGTTFERESWRVPAEGVTHVRLVIQPDKGGAPHRATMTSLTIR